jgi:acetyltransferase-like isoleucine patch superfamily enzyme
MLRAALPEPFMRREHHPYWYQRLLARGQQRIAEHFVVPQLESVGVEPRFAGMRYMRFLGPNIHVGDHFHAFATPEQPLSLAVNPYDGGVGGGEIVIGNYCILSCGVRIRSAISIHIGDNTMLAERCLITDADWHDAYHRIYPGKKGPVRIGRNVWLGDSVTVCKGVTIGDNSIVGAASVVTRDIPPNSIAAGNPARVVSELDPALPSSRREHLFVGGTPYDQFKQDYDRARLSDNTLVGWLRSTLWPTKGD